MREVIERGDRGGIAKPKFPVIAETAALTLTAVGCAVILYLSIVPGYLMPTLFVWLVATLAVLAVLALPMTAVAVAARRKLMALTRSPQIHQNVSAMLRSHRLWRCVLTMILMLGCTYVLLRFYVPRRIAFAASKDAFVTQLTTVPVSVRDGEPFDKRLGFFDVDRVAADPRGGVFFRVHSEFKAKGNDSSSANRVSYGFVHQPNATGSPFGAAGYRLHRLGGDWYWFRASDDSY
jgi:hypothetical protein